MPLWRRKEDRERRTGERPGERDRDVFDDPFFDMRSDVFADFDDRFRRMRACMDSMMEKAASGELWNPGEGAPFVHGWSMRVGPDGVPHVQTFGNVRPPAMRAGRALPGGEPGPGAMMGDEGAGPGRTGQGRPGRRAGSGRSDAGEESAPGDLLAGPGVREPLTDIREGDTQITVIAEMPGIEKDNIELETGDDFLVIKVDRGNRRFFKELPFDCSIVPGSARARYNNGVLEITLDKAPVDRKGTKVEVE